MKVFLVFLGLLLVNMSFLCFHGDMDRYEKLQTLLKATAEECAAGAALCQQESKYGEGYLVIEEGKAAEYISFLIQDTERKLPETLKGELNYEVRIFDDEKGYEEYRNYGLQRESPAVWISITLKSKDLFRLPFLEQKETKRTAVYQWESN